MGTTQLLALGPAQHGAAPLAESIRRQGLRRHFGRLTEPYGFLAPNEFVIQYFGRPVSLALRLGGNIFASGLMVMVIGQLPAYLLWLPTAGWKLFDMFVGCCRR